MKTTQYHQYLGQFLMDLLELRNFINVLVNCCHDDLSAKMLNKFGYANNLVNLDSLVTKNSLGNNIESLVNNNGSSPTWLWFFISGWGVGSSGKRVWGGRSRGWAHGWGF